MRTCHGMAIGGQKQVMIDEMDKRTAYDCNKRKYKHGPHKNDRVLKQKGLAVESSRTSLVFNLDIVRDR